MGTTLVINPGSSSKKYALFDGTTLLGEYRFERTGHGYEVCTSVLASGQTCRALKKDEYFGAIKTVLTAAQEGETDTVFSGVGIRIVAPGSYFQSHRRITAEYIKRLKAQTTVAPLHIPSIVAEIEQVQKTLPKVPLIAVSDSAFHATLPPRARIYSIEKSIAQDHDLHRFGYHGLSAASVVRRLHSVLGDMPSRTIVCHIGSGVSVTAICDGKSVETSMGFSPSSGVIMGTRAGDLDAGALLELMRVKHWRPLDAQTYIQTSGGLLGLSGESDIRSLLDRVAQQDAEAEEALEAFVYQIARAVAGGIVALGGLDALVLTATVSERSPELRALLLAQLVAFGITIDTERNSSLVGRDGVISVHHAPIKVAVMRTDELGELARVVHGQEW